MILDIVFLAYLSIFYRVNADNPGSQCGCKELRECYRNMLSQLQDRDETTCIEDASIGASTITIFLKAIAQFCPRVMKVSNDFLTFEGRYLYEVVLESPRKEKDELRKPIIIIEAGQQGGTEPVAFALYVIEQLVACKENKHMLDQVKWVIMPCTNPDGQEYSRYNPSPWKKNLKPSEDNLSFGVDITRNFESQWSSCRRIDSGFSPIYPGPSASSENETIFIKNVLNKHKKDTKLYVSIKRDGHHILYPYGHSRNNPPNIGFVTKVAAEVAHRVNQRTSGVHVFNNMSIFAYEGAPHCGHSVDYAFDIGIPLAYEMRVFIKFFTNILSKFQTMPKGYDASLRNGYFSGIKELYNAVTNAKKYGRFR